MEQQWRAGLPAWLPGFSILCGSSLWWNYGIWAILGGNDWKFQYPLRIEPLVEQLVTKMRAIIRR